MNKSVMEGYVEESKKAKQLFTYSASAVYNVGDVIIETNNIYQCNTQILIPEAFTILKWTLLGSATGAFIYKGAITLPADFPTVALVQNGWTYSIAADVTDNDATKTNTGQSFLLGDIISWDGSAWVDVTGIEQFLDNGADKTPIGARGVDILTGQAYKINSVNIKDVTEILTNKTIDGDDNTIQDLALTSLKTVIGQANKILHRDASGIVVDSPVEIDASGNIDFVAGGMTDDNVTVAVKLGSATNTSLNTTNKDILGGINELEQIRDLTKEPTGFTAPEDVIVTGDSSTRKITLTGTVNGYYKGEKVTALVTSWESDAHGTDTAKRYILIYDGSFSWVDLSTVDEDYYSNLLIAIAFYNPTDSEWAYQRECHGLQPWQSHRLNHDTIGTFKHNGGTLSGYTLASTTAADRRPLISESLIYDEDLPSSILELATETYTQFYLNGAGEDVNFIDVADDIVPLSTNQPYYNQFTGGAWQQTLLATTQYMAVWTVLMPMALGTSSQKLRQLFVQGQQVSSVLANIQALTTNDVNLGELKGLTPELVFTTKTIIRYIGGNWTLIEVNDLIGTKLSQSQSPTGNYLSSVSSDATLTGTGIVGDSLSVVQSYPILLGASGGQTLIGGTGAGESLTLQSTSHGTKGGVLIPETGDTLILGATTDAATPRVSMKTKNSGFAAPSAANTDSDGDKYVFWNSAVFKGAVGMDANEMWFQSMGTAGSDRFRFYTGDATTPSEVCRFGETEIIFNEARTDRDFKIGKVTSGYSYIYDYGAETHTWIGDASISGSTTIGSAGVAGTADLKNSGNVSKVHFNTEGDSYVNGGDTAFGTTTPDTLVEIETETDEGDAGLTLDQNDADEPFINFEGTSAADQTNNISTVNGDGAVDGPKNFSSSAGWTFEGMVRQNVNGTDYWMPFYSAQTS